MTLRFDPEQGWTFELADGTRRVLRDPDGPPTSRQLLLLAHRGLLELRSEAGAALTKLEAARAIDAARELEGEGARCRSRARKSRFTPAVIFLSLVSKKDVYDL